MAALAIGMTPDRIADGIGGRVGVTLAKDGPGEVGRGVRVGRARAVVLPAYVVEKPRNHGGFDEPIALSIDLGRDDLPGQQRYLPQMVQPVEAQSFGKTQPGKAGLFDAFQHGPY